MSRLAVGAFDVVCAAVLLLCAALLQVTVVPDLQLFSGRPDLVVLVAASIALLRGPLAGSLAGFVGGLLVDTLGLGLVGSSSLVLTAVGYRVGVSGERIPDAAPLRPLLAICAATFASDLGALLIAVLIGSGPSLGAHAFLATVPGAMLNLLLAIGLYPLLRLAMRRRLPRVPLATEAVPG